MRLYYHCLCVLLSLFVDRELFPMSFKVKILKLMDGDSLQIQLFAHSERVRLRFIDAPELGQKDIRGRVDLGEFSKLCVQRFLSKEMTLNFKGRDIYGRILGSFEGLEIKLLENGCVSVYQPTIHLCPECWRARERARRKRVGIWQFSGLRRASVYRKLVKKKARSKAGLASLGGKKLLER